MLEQPNLPRVGSVDPHFVNLPRVLPEILDVTQNMAPAVLTNEVSQIRAQAHVRDGGLVVSPFLNREALEEDEAFAVDEVGSQGVQIGGQLGEGEVALLVISMLLRSRSSTPWQMD